MKRTIKYTTAKAISWETVSNIPCLYFAWLLFGNFGSCLLFTVGCIALKLILFVPHDKTWDKVKWGKQPKHKKGPTGVSQ